MDKGIENNRTSRVRKKLKKARGQPGAKPRWTSGAKTIVGTAVRPESRDLVHHQQRHSRRDLFP